MFLANFKLGIFCYFTHLPERDHLLFFSLSHVSLFVTPMNYSTLGFPVFHYLPELAQVHIHWMAILFNISSSAALFSFCLQSFPASGSFPMSQLFALGGQSIGVSASASVLPVSIQGWFPLALTGLISLQSKGLWRVFSLTTVFKYQFFGTQPSLWPSSHICTWLLEKL